MSVMGFVVDGEILPYYNGFFPCLVHFLNKLYIRVEYERDYTTSCYCFCC